MKTELENHATSIQFGGLGAVKELERQFLRYQEQREKQFESILRYQEHQEKQQAMLAQLSQGVGRFFTSSTGVETTRQNTGDFSKKAVSVGTEKIRQNQELAEQVKTIQAIFGDMPFNEVLAILQAFIQEHQRKQNDKPETPACPLPNEMLIDVVRAYGIKGKEKQLQNSVKEKFRLGKFQELFLIWAARLQSQEYGVQAKFIAIVQAHYDEYIDDLIRKDVKMSEKDKVLSDDAVRRWLKRIQD